MCFTMCFFGSCEGNNGVYTGHLEQLALVSRTLAWRDQVLGETVLDTCARTKYKSTVTLFSLLPSHLLEVMLQNVTLGFDLAKCAGLIIKWFSAWDLRGSGCLESSKSIKF